MSVVHPPSFLLFPSACHCFVLPSITVSATLKNKLDNLRLVPFSQRLDGKCFKQSVKGAGVFENNFRLCMCVRESQQSIVTVYSGSRFFRVLSSFPHKADPPKSGGFSKKTAWWSSHFENIIWVNNFEAQLALRIHPGCVFHPHPLFPHPWFHCFLLPEKISGQPTQAPFTLALCPRPTLPSDPWSQDPMPWPPFASMDPSPLDPLSHAPFGFFTHQIIQNINILIQLLQHAECFVHR